MKVYELITKNAAAFATALLANLKLFLRTA
jgi:hypothetical protein